MYPQAPGAIVLSMAKKPSIDDLIHSGADLVRKWHRTEESRTDLLRELAEVVVDLRAAFGDWSGHDWEYRQAITRLYEEAGVPTDSVASVQAALRYHVGNALRRRVAPEDLKAAGLMAASPRERIAAARVEVVNAAEAGGYRPSSGRTVAPLLLALRVSLDRLEGRLDALDAAEVAEVVETLEMVRERAAFLLRAARRAARAAS
jgi:hypothetical protein